MGLYVSVFVKGATKGVSEILGKSRKTILDIEKALSSGEITLLDSKLVHLNKENSKKAFIHFKNWNKDDRSQYVKDIITSGKDFKIIYSMPWYWICKQSNYY